MGRPARGSRRAYLMKSACSDAEIASHVLLCVARGVDRMARIDRVKKKAVDVEAVFQDRLSRVAQDTEALLERLLTPRHLDGAVSYTHLTLPTICSV